MKIVRDCIFDPSLVLYLPLYKLDGASIMSRDAYGHLGTVTGALWRPNGRSFDGDDDIDVGDNSLFELQDFSLSIWAKVTDDATHSALVNLQVDRAGSGNMAGIETLYTNANKFMFRVTTDANTMEGPTTDDTIALNTWFQAVFTKSGTAAKIYINGDLSKEGTLTTATVYYVSGHNTRVGVSWSGTAKNTFMNGTIGEVLVHNRALTSLEIQNIYLATKWRYR